MRIRLINFGILLYHLYITLITGESQESTIVIYLQHLSLSLVSEVGNDYVVQQELEVQVVDRHRKAIVQRFDCTDIFIHQFAVVQIQTSVISQPLEPCFLCLQELWIIVKISITVPCISIVEPE